MYANGMKSGAVWLRILALCSTVALGSGYVWWSQKKADEKRAKEAEARERMILPGSKSKVIVSDGRVEVPGAAGWKGQGRTNADFIEPVDEQKEERTVLPGSKSFALGRVNGESVDRILNASEREKEEPKEPERRTVLPGSKSIDPILSPDHKP
jgi:hypothetical protein